MRDERAAGAAAGRGRLPARGGPLRLARAPRIDRSLEGRGAAANDVHMLVATGGRQRLEAELRSLYAGAGFTLTRIGETPARLSRIEGAPR